jgi:hypothetical protein
VACCFAVVFLAEFMALLIAGMRREARIAMIAMTTRSSISVKACRERCFKEGVLTDLFGEE